MSKLLTLSELRRNLSRQLLAAGIEAASLEASLILEFITQLDRSEQILAAEDVISAATAKKSNDIVERRITGEPLDHIFGFREFYGFDFRINKHVLSPRPETEMIVDMVIGKTDKEQKFTFLDLGTGSGAIPISILKHRPQAKGAAIDVSPLALEIAAQNADHHKVAERLHLIEGNWADDIQTQFDFVLSNPPYIDKEHMENLPRDVADYDPDLALFGGENGLECYEAISPQLSHLLVPGGQAILEIGYNQAKPVISLLKQAALVDLQVHQDLAGLDRIVSGRKPCEASTKI